MSVIKKYFCCSCGKFKSRFEVITNKKDKVTYTEISHRCKECGSDRIYKSKLILQEMMRKETYDKTNYR